MHRLISLFLVVLLFAVGLPVHAQGGIAHTVSFDGFSFTFDDTFGTQVHIRQVPGDRVELEIPGGPEPAYTEFDVFTVGVGEASATPRLFEAPLGVRVYRTADIAAYEESQEQVEQLAALRNQYPDLAVYTQPEGIIQHWYLPFLPVVPAMQIIRGQAHYVDQPTFSGIAFLTAYRQGPGPFLGNEFFYTFQGLSADGQYYVSAVVPLQTALFPDDVPAGFNYDAWIGAIDAYYAESQATLNNAAPADFVPSLDVIDAIFAGFTFGS
jgi:hypothetical protein